MDITNHIIDVIIHGGTESIIALLLLIIMGMGYLLRQLTRAIRDRNKRIDILTSDFKDDLADKEIRLDKLAEQIQSAHSSEVEAINKVRLAINELKNKVVKQ